MRLLPYPTLVFLFLMLIVTGLKAQTPAVTGLACIPHDSLTTPVVPPFFGDEDPCCGQFIRYNVCYDLESYFAGTMLTPEECDGLKLLGFEYPGGSYTGDVLMGTASDLANLLNSILTVAGLPELAVFSAHPSLFIVCADSLTSDAFLHITIRCKGNIVQINPGIDEFNACPVNVRMMENAFQGILNSDPYDDMTLFHLDNTAVPGSNVSGGPVSTSDIVNGSTWDIPDGSTVNPDALPTDNDLGHLLNAVFGSGLMNFGGCSSDININCMLIELLQFPLDSLDDEEIMIMNEVISREEAEAVLEGLQDWATTLEADGGSMASYINGIFGWNLPDIPCDTGGGSGLRTRTGERNSQAQDLAKMSNPNDIRSSADPDYFSQDIPGIGTGSTSPPTPSALAMMQEISGGVNLYNGAMNANIPLHTLQAYDISVPISISSSNNGLKVDDIGSSAGQHWSINAGGQITRTVKGLPDEFDGTIYSTGVGQQVIYTPQIDIPSILGAGIQLGICPTQDALSEKKQLVRTGIKKPFSIGQGSNPITGEIAWSGFQPDKISLVFKIPIFSFPINNVVYIQVGMHIGFGKRTLLMPIEYREKALGYAHIDNAAAMDEIGLPALTEDLLEGVSSGNDKLKVLKTVHPGRKRDDNSVVSNLAGTWAAVRATFQLRDEGRVIHKTERIDLQPDEFHFTAGAYSGKFFIKPSGQIYITPYQPGVNITPDFQNGELISFQVETPDGFVYTYGRYEDSTYIDYTQDLNYYLPNFYTYPEKNISRTDFWQAQTDVSMLEQRWPVLNSSLLLTPYSNTYNRNYKITNGPRYASAWHLAHIRSIRTQEEVTFDYAERKGLSWFSNKSYSHTFPNFAIDSRLGGEPIGHTIYLLQHNPLHLTRTRWENGRAEFTYTATQTTQDRWDLTKIKGNRGEQIVLLYDQPKGEIHDDVVCSQIRVLRNGNLYRGWDLNYDYTDVFETPPSIGCDSLLDEEGGSFPINVTKETTFSLGTLYRPTASDYYKYLWLYFNVCKRSFPFRLRFPKTFDPSHISHRTAMSELGSLIEVRALSFGEFEKISERKNIPHPAPWLGFDANRQLDIFRAEGRRTFLETIKEIDQNEVLHDFVDMDYFNTAALPKRFSTNQDQYGYPNDNKSTGSPFPAISYQSIFPINGTSTVNSTASGMQVHYGFSNKDATSPDGTYKGQAPPSFEHAHLGAIRALNMASGASISFGYELNVLEDGATPGAGLRVVKKVEAPGETPSKITEYTYQNPSVNTLPRHVSQNPKDVYYRASQIINEQDLETRVQVSSYPQNMMLPNGGNLTGYGQVTESWSDIGRVVHHFTTPDNFAGAINIDSATNNYNIEYHCFLNKKDDVFNPGFIFTDNCSITEQTSPAVFLPDILKQFDLFFGREWKTETFNAAGEEVLLNTRQYQLADIKRQQQPKMRLFQSSMYQLNRYGTFGQMFARRLIAQYAPYAIKEAEVSQFITNLISLVFENTPFQGRYVERRFETVHYDYPMLEIQLIQSETKETHSGGGTSSSETTLDYLPDLGKELLVHTQTVNYSDNNVVSTHYHYPFQLGLPGASSLLSLHDDDVITYLNAHQYLQPVAQETFVNGIRTQANLTADTLLLGNKIGPRANYGLQNGNFALLGKFEQHNADAKPERYFLAKFGANLSSDPSEFFDPIHLEWTGHLALPLHKRTYLSFETTHNFSGFFEYAGIVDHNGVTTAYGYDQRGRVEEVSRLSNHQITKYFYTIGPGANSVRMETRYGTGEIMDLLQQIDGLGKDMKLTRLNDGALINTKKYDSFWRVLAERNIGTGIIDYEYEASPLSKLLKSTDAVGNVVQYAYKGQPPYFKTIAVTDPNGHTNESFYNSLEQLTGTRNIPEQSKVEYIYDGLLRLSLINNPIGEKFIYEYNPMGLLWQTTVPGRGAQRVWYDHKFRPVASSDGNGHHILNEYDDKDRVWKTYLPNPGFTIAGSGISNDDLSSQFTVDKLLSAVTYASDSSTWVTNSENRLLEATTPNPPIMVVSDNQLDNIGRVVQSVTQYPDAELTASFGHSSAGFLLTSTQLVAHNSGSTEEITNEFKYDHVLRPESHKVYYGNGQWVMANRMSYDGEDLLLTKLVGGVPLHENKFLQEVNYAYDPIGRLVRINNPGTFFCNIEQELCSFSLKLIFPREWSAGADCRLLTDIKINGQTYALQTPIDILTQQRGIAPAIEGLLDAYGLGGRVIVNYEENADGHTLTIEVRGSQATELALTLANCSINTVFDADCCTIPPLPPVPPSHGPGGPEICTADLYHQTMGYNGLDINRIAIGSGCGFMMRNNYEYDGLHRITAMKNVFFGQQPYPDAFSTTYSYDPAGNIQTLTRRGIIDMGAGNAPQSDFIDDLRFTYSAPGGAPSSVLSSVSDMASNPLAQPLGMASTLSGYGHDGNGNVTGAGDVSASQYNIMNQPSTIAHTAGRTRHFAYIYGGGKYKTRLLINPDFEETRHYLGGLEFVDGEPENYNFGDGRIVWIPVVDSTTQDTVKVPQPQFRLTDHLGNTVVYFHDKNNDGCITTEANTNDPEELEVIQRFWYYPFGMAMQGLRDWATEPGQWYRYNGKERDTVSGWYEYGARWYIDEIGRWNGVDPLTGKMPGWSPYSYGFDNPISFNDPTGMKPESVDDIIIRAKNINGDYQEVLRVKSDIVDKTIDLDIPGLTMHEPLSNAPFDHSLTISEIVPGVSFDKFISGGGESMADAWSLDFQGALAVKLGVGGSMSLVGFLNGPDAGEVFGFIQGSVHGGFAAGGGLTVSAYYSNIPSSKFGYQALEGLEMGLQGSYGAFGASTFFGVGFPKPLYYGYSLGVSKGVPNTPKVNTTVYVGMSAKFKKF